MRIIRAGVALAAFSPAFLLLGLGLWGRWATFGVPPTPGDPASFAERLRAYRTFVVAAREAAEECRDAEPLEPGAYRSLWNALDAAQPAALPAIETAVTAPPARDDVRKPILEAESRTFLSAKKAYEGLLARRSYREAAKLGIAIHRLTLVSRNFEFSPYVASSNQRTQLARMLAAGMSCFDEASRKEVRECVIAGERMVNPPYEIMNNDVLLLRLDFANTAQTTPREMAIPRVAEEALHRARDGESLGWYLKRISQWPATQDRDRIWQLIASWEIMLKRHETDKRHLLRAVSADSLNAQLNH